MDQSSLLVQEAHKIRCTRWIDQERTGHSIFTLEIWLPADLLESGGEDIIHQKWTLAHVPKLQIYTFYKPVITNPFGLWIDVDSNLPTNWSQVFNRYSLMVFCCFVVGSWRLFRQVSWQSRWCRMSARLNLGWVSVQHPLVASSTGWIPSKGLSQGGSANQQPHCCLTSLTTIPHFLVALIPNSPYIVPCRHIFLTILTLFFGYLDHLTILNGCVIVALLSPSKNQHWSLGSVGRKWPSSGFRTSWTFSSIPFISRISPCPLKVQVGVMEPTAAKEKIWRTPERWLFSQVAALHEIYFISLHICSYIHLYAWFFGVIEALSACFMLFSRFFGMTIPFQISLIHQVTHCNIVKYICATIY